MELPVSADYLNAVFKKEKQLDNNETLIQSEVGELVLTTGRLIACDPLSTPDWRPFEGLFPVGSFPVVLSIARIATDQRVAFATIHFKKSEPVSWEMLTVGNQDLSRLAPGEMFGYPVDSGTGCFMDAAAGAALVIETEADPNHFETLCADLEKTYRHTWSWLNREYGPANLVAFSSGYGDGLYATYAGRDADAEICAVVTDFAVIDS